MNDQSNEFWVKLGMDIGAMKKSSENTEKAVDQLNDKMDKFISNDFQHLEEKVNKISTKIAVIMGVVSFVWILIQIAIKVIPLIRNLPS